MSGKKESVNSSSAEKPEIEQSTDRSVDKGQKQIKSEKLRYENADEIYE
ncbi:hypothetical protein [Paenibacillus harenae]|nr:hypothetical protein [Paenibacillus harenae]